MTDLSLSRSQMLLLSGSANRGLAEEVAAHLGQPLCQVTIRHFADGELFVCGRTKDLIIRHGRKYHPPDLESAIAEVRLARQVLATYSDMEELIRLGAYRAECRSRSVEMLILCLEGFAVDVDTPADLAALPHRHEIAEGQRRPCIRGGQVGLRAARHLLAQAPGRQHGGVAVRAARDRARLHLDVARAARVSDLPALPIAFKKLR